MNVGQPSLFDQLTPSDSLRDDLDWLDSLQETEPAPRKTRGRGRKPDKTRHDVDATPAPREEKNTTPKPEHETRRPADSITEPPAPMPLIPDTGTDDGTMTGMEPDGMTASDMTDDGAIPVETESVRTVLADDDTSDVLFGLGLEDVADSTDGGTRDKTTMKWVARVLIGVGAIILLLLLFALAGSHSASVRQKASYDRLQTSMSQLATANTKAKATLKQAGRLGLDDSADALRHAIESNGMLMKSKRTGLSIEASDRLAGKADEASEHTRELSGRIAKTIKDKPLTDAKRKCSTALDKAVKASDDAKPSDDTTRKAKETLDKLAAQARGLGSKTTVGQWNDMAAKLDKAREDLTNALDAKAKADEEAKRQAEEQARQQAQQQQQQASPTPQPTPQYHRQSGGSTSIPRGNNGGGTTNNNNGGTSNGNSGGWYVPPETNDNSLPSNDSSL